MSVRVGAVRPRVSIIMPSRDQGRFIAEAIESVLAQDYPAIDFLVVDALSTDGTVDILRGYGDRVRWISEPDEGQGDAIDKGIRLTTGDIVGWLNSDDIYAPGAVSDAVAALDAHPAVAAVYGNAQFIDAAGQILGPCTQVEPFDLRRLIDHLDYIVQPATFFRRDAYLAAGGIDRSLHYCLDYDLWIRLGIAAPLHHIDQVLASVRVYPATKTAGGGLRRLEEIERMIRRHGRAMLPRDFQREAVTEARRSLRHALSGRRRDEAWRALRILGRYGPPTLLRRLGRAVRATVRRVRAWLRGPEVPRGRLRAFARGARAKGTPTGVPSVPGSLAIVVPCYRHAPCLAAMFESIVGQTRPPDEVVFVDDASDDGTSDVLRGLIDCLPEATRARYRVIRNDRNEGQAASLNRAIGMTASDAIMVLNDDDYLMPDAVEFSLRLFARHPDVALIGAHSIHFAGLDPRAVEPRTIASQLGPAGLTLDIRRPADALLYRRYNDLNMTHSGSCFLKLAWIAVGGYYADPRRRIVPFSDRDLQLRINALFSVGLSPIVAFSLWRSDSSVDHGRNT